MTTKTKIRAVGNSRGVIIPKKFLEQCGIEENVDISIQDNVITISATHVVKKRKWSDFRRSGKTESATLIRNNFDDREWTW